MFTVKGISHDGEVTLVEGYKVKVEHYENGSYVRLYDDRGSDEWFYSFDVTGVREEGGDPPGLVAAAVIENANGKTSEVIRCSH